MSAFHLSAQLRFSDRSPAQGVRVKLHEHGGSDFDLGAADANGQVSADIRNKRQITVRDPRDLRKKIQVDDPLDHPLFDLTATDAFGRSFLPPPLPYGGLSQVQVLLPPNLKANTPSNIADHALQPLVDDHAPGRVFMVRKNGAVWAEAAHGKARYPAPPAMTNDTIVHVASMSKPICATALLALVEDWAALRGAVAQVLAGAAVPRQTLNLSMRIGRRNNPLGSVAVPDALAPLFASHPAARDFVNAGFATRLSADLAPWLNRFASDVRIVASPPPAIPPGYFGLLRRVMQGVPPPLSSDPFLPLLQSRLQAAKPGTPFVAGANVGLISLGQLLTHSSALIDDASAGQLPGWDALQHQPIDGSAVSYDLWAVARLLCEQAANASGGYRNNNYTLLGAVVEACAEQAYDSYVEQRLLQDDRFSRIRRHVVNPAASASAWYYRGQPPLWSLGIPFPDYSGYSAAGGFYATAAQMTDWLHALFTGQAVAQPGGARAMVSPAGVTALFGSVSAAGFFRGGTPDTNLPRGVVGYRKDGGTGLGNDVHGGSMNGEMSVLVGPAGAVHTAFFVGNGNFDASPPFLSVMTDLINGPDWD